MLDIVPAAMVVIDGQGVIHAFGKAAQSLFGYCEDEVIGQDISILMGSPHAERHAGYLRRYHETGERRMIGTSRVENARHSDGHLFPIEITVAETKVEGLQCFVGFLRPIGANFGDRTEIFSKLGELAHASRISAMGALVTSIAHELNQPLTSIANYAEGLRDLLGKRTDIEGVDEYIGVLDICSRQAIRAGQLIHRLREFVKGGEPHGEAVPVERLVSESVTLALINGFKKSVRLENDVPHGIPAVLVDPLQGQQVLVNLILNALEAMHAEHGSDHLMRIRVKMNTPSFVEFSVEDSGPGIDPDIRDRVFESFLTTKGSGMGVGLAISKQIVEAYGGTIRAEQSADLGGAAFRFTLPVAPGQLPTAD